MKKGEREEKQGVGSFTGSKRRRDGWNNKEKTRIHNICATRADWTGHVRRERKKRAHWKTVDELIGEEGRKQGRRSVENR